MEKNSTRDQICIPELSLRPARWRALARGAVREMQRFQIVAVIAEVTRAWQLRQAMTERQHT